MIKNLRIILCLLCAVILPFSLVACKDKSKSTTDSDSSIISPTPETPGGGSESGDVPGQETNYVLDEAEVIRLLDCSSGKCDDFVLKLNELSQILDENNYSSSMGDRTSSSLSYANYPKLVLNALIYKLNLKAQSFKLGEIYAYISGAGVYRFIEIDVQDNDKILMNIVSWDLSTFVYYNFEFTVGNGNISSVNVAKLTSPSRDKKIEFINAFVDFDNLKLVGSFGNVNGFYLTSEKFFNEYFTEENFGEIPSNNWGYSQFEELTISPNKDVKLSVDKGGEDIVSDFENFGFLDAFVKYNDYMALTSAEFVSLQDDIFGVIDVNGERYTYNSDEFTFDEIV